MLLLVSSVKLVKELCEAIRFPGLFVRGRLENGVSLATTPIERTTGVAGFSRQGLPMGFLLSEKMRRSVRDSHGKVYNHRRLCFSP